MFKPYAIIETVWGVRFFHSQAFMHPDYLDKHGWQCLIENSNDEEVFRFWKPSYAWVIDSANKKGFGSPPS